MLNEVVINVGRLIVLILLQALLFNSIDLFNGAAVPFVYVLIILALPFDVPRWIELIIGFAVGLTMDAFNSTPGLHASACVTLAFFRPLLIKALAPREGYEFGMKPKVRDMGFRWFLYYAGILIFIHHAWLFYIEVFSFSYFFSTLWRVLLSSVFTLVLVIITQYLAFGPSRGS